VLCVSFGNPTLMTTHHVQRLRRSRTPEQLLKTEMPTARFMAAMQCAHLRHLSRADDGRLRPRRAGSLRDANIESSRQRQSGEPQSRGIANGHASGGLDLLNPRSPEGPASSDRIPNRLARVISTFLAILAFSGMAIGQVTTGTILGNVRDSTGAVVADATVTITDTEKGEVSAYKTAANGDYNAPFLIPERNLGAEDRVAAAKRLEDLGCDFVIHHVGYDERRGLGAMGKPYPSLVFGGPWTDFIQGSDIVKCSSTVTSRMCFMLQNGLARDSSILNPSESLNASAPAPIAK
jgi:hypothetical protein